MGGITRQGKEKRAKQGGGWWGGGSFGGEKMRPVVIDTDTIRIFIYFCRFLGLLPSQTAPHVAREYRRQGSCGRDLGVALAVLWVLCCNTSEIDSGLFFGLFFYLKIPFFFVFPSFIIHVRSNTYVLITAARSPGVRPSLPLYTPISSLMQSRSPPPSCMGADLE